GRRDRGGALARTAQAHPGPRQPPRHRPPDRPPRRPGAGRGARGGGRRESGEQRGPERRQRRLAEGRARQRAGLPVSAGRPVAASPGPDRAGGARKPPRPGMAAQRRDRRRHAPARRDRLHSRPERGGRAGAPAKEAPGGVGSVKSPRVPADAGALFEPRLQYEPTRLKPKHWIPDSAGMSGMNGGGPLACRIGGGSVADLSSGASLMSIRLSRRAALISSAVAATGAALT